jgi:hypothetical protein
MSLSWKTFSLYLSWNIWNDVSKALTMASWKMKITWKLISKTWYTFYFEQWYLLWQRLHLQTRVYGGVLVAPVTEAHILLKTFLALFYILVTVHLGTVLINNQPDTQFLLYIFISILYLFRATLCSSSGETIVSIQHLLYVTPCRWPYGVQVG